MNYTVQRVACVPALDGDWSGAVWQKAEILKIDQVRPESSEHHPITRAKLLYDARHIYVLFDVADRFVRSTVTEYLGSVYNDSCVEFFVQPKLDKGYFNIEVNCGGALLLYYIEDPTPMSDEFAKFTKVPPELGRRVTIYHSMPEVVDPEMVGDTTWRIQYALPLDLLGHYVDAIGDPAGQTWRANFYKCADNSSHPHWMSWAPIAGPLNFHQPQYFQIGLSA